MLIAATTLFAWLHESWWLYAALFFVPDVTFAAYLLNASVGAAAYNALHSYLGPLSLLFAVGLQSATLAPIALIWTAHIGFDRAAGYGLKYSSTFGDTHLGYKGQGYKGQ